MAPTKIVQQLIDMLRALGEAGPFALGVGFGAVITGLSFLMAGRERTARLSLDLKPEEALFKQLQQKDERINKLHAEIERLSRKGK